MMDLYVRTSAWANLEELKVAGAKSANVGNDEMSDHTLVAPSEFLLAAVLRSASPYGLSRINRNHFWPT
jgi:hypothetical protein